MRKVECPLCHTTPARKYGYEEVFCKCGMVHVVQKKRKSENAVARRCKGLLSMRKKK